MSSPTFSFLFSLEGLSITCPLEVFLMSSSQLVSLHAFPLAASILVVYGIRDTEAHIRDLQSFHFGLHAPGRGSLLTPVGLVLASGRSCAYRRLLDLHLHIHSHGTLFGLLSIVNPP